jgi:hypothetical protein
VIEYAEDYLRQNSLTASTAPRVLTIHVWGARESDGRTAPPAVCRFRLVVEASDLADALGVGRIGREIGLESMQ